MIVAIVQMNKGASVSKALYTVFHGDSNQTEPIRRVRASDVRSASLRMRAGVVLLYLGNMKRATESADDTHRPILIADGLQDDHEILPHLMSTTALPAFAGHFRREEVRRCRWYP